MKPKIYLLCIVQLAVGSICAAQLPADSVRDLTQAEYWLNDDLQNRMTFALSGGDTVKVNQKLDFSLLTPNLYKLTLRFKNRDGLYSMPLVSYFLKREATATTPIDEIDRAEYWLNDDYNNRTPIAITSAQTLDLRTQTDLSALAPNAYKFSVRFRGKSGNWSVPYISFFIKRQAGTEPNQIQFVEKAEYWFNDDYSSCKPISFAGGSLINLNQQIDVSALAPNTYKLSIRFKDQNGWWSVPYSAYFFKRDKDNNQVQFITKAEYWLNDDYTTCKAIPLTGGSIANLSQHIDFKSLSPNVYKYSMRVCDINGLWSVPYVTYFFVREKTTTPVEPKIVGFRYFVDDQIEYAQTELFATPVTLADINALVNLPVLALAGNHTFTIQLIDDIGQYSVPIQFAVNILLTEIFAWFKANQVADCGVLTVKFNNLSLGAVAYSWNFGDGTTSTDANPIHIYTDAGKYTVTLTMNSALGITLTNTRADYLRVYTKPTMDIANKDVYPTTEQTITLHAGNFASYRWLLDNSTNEYLVVPNTTASYQVLIFNELGCSSIETIRVHGLITENNEVPVTRDGLMLYPNPVTDNFYLKLDDDLKVSSIDVYDINGRIVRTFKVFDELKSGMQSFAVSNLPGGIYQLKLHSNFGIKSVRIIKK